MAEPADKSGNAAGILAMQPDLGIGYSWPTGGVALLTTLTIVPPLVISSFTWQPTGNAIFGF